MAYVKSILVCLCFVHAEPGTSFTSQMDRAPASSPLWQVMCTYLGHTTTLAAQCLSSAGIRSLRKVTVSVSLTDLTGMGQEQRTSVYCQQGSLI